MRPQTLFAALAEIAAEHTAHKAEHLLVLPTVTDELESRRDLLSEVSEVLGGVLLDVTAGAYDVAVEAFDDPVLRGDVSQSLTFDHASGGERTETRVVLETGRVDVELSVRGRRITVPSPAERSLMGVARALFDVRLLDHELAILLYDEKTFDDDAQRAVLSMITGLGRKTSLRLGTVRTLVPFIQSAGLDRGRHCQANRGVRFGLVGPDLIRRNPTEHLRMAVRRLTAHREQPLVLFLGAGFSASSGMPVGNSVRNAAIRRVLELPDPNDGRSDEELAASLWDYANQPPAVDLLSGLEKTLGRDEFARAATLEHVARIEAELLRTPVPQAIEELRAHHNDRVHEPTFVFGDAVYAMHRIIEDGRRVVLITVNFDELVEHDHTDALDIAVDDADFERLTPILAAMRAGGEHPDAKIPLLKLHGTINRPETCVVTDAQTRSGISPAKNRAIMSLADDLPDHAQAPWVYVGASMRDIDLDHVFSANQFNESGVSELWVAPWTEDSVRRFVDGKNRWWAARDDLLRRTVTENADAFMQALADGWPS